VGNGTRPKKGGRGPTPDVPSTQAKVAAIRQRMACLGWNEATRAELAKEWHLGEHRVSELAAEASRSLRVDDPEELAQLRGQLAATLEEILRRALGDRNKTTGQLDLRAAIEATLMLSRFRGVAPAEDPLIAINAVAPVFQVTPEIALAFDDFDSRCPHCGGSGRIQSATAANGAAPALLTSLHSAHDD
jgi:hypothetical protein